MHFRAIHWDTDGNAIRKLDTIFVTDRIYAVRQSGLSFSLVEEAQTTPFTKRYGSALTEGQIASALLAIAVCEANELHGIAIVAKEEWNRRAVITDFFIDRQSRRRGFGRGMIQEISKRLGGEFRLLWVETQNVNLPAIAFYRRVGFEVCGFDSTLYDGQHSTEVAVFLSKSLQTHESDESNRFTNSETDESHDQNPSQERHHRESRTLDRCDASASGDPDAPHRIGPSTEDL